MIHLRLPGDHRDAARLQRLREAMELFSMLAFVNIDAFNEMVISLAIAWLDGHISYPPIWNLLFVGTLSPQDVAASQTEVTWGTFLGFRDDPLQCSPGFQAAAQKLEALRVDKPTTTVKGVDGRAAINWSCRLQGSELYGSQYPDESDGPSRTRRSQIRDLFDLAVPPIVRMCATRGAATFLTTWSPANSHCEGASAAIGSWGHPGVSDLSAALARTAIANLSLDLNGTLMISRQAVLNLGFMMNSLLCGHVVRLVTENGSKHLNNSIPVVFGEMNLQCWTCKWAFTAICSAVAALSAESHLDSWSIDLKGSGRWPWLIHAICGGTSGVVVPCVKIWKGTLTKTDILAMRAALRANYPQPVSETSHSNSYQYGFVEVEEGTELHLCGDLLGGGDSSIVVASACRCRALFDPNDSEWINFVVPGYGACKAKLGNRGVRFTADTGESKLREKRLSGAVELHYVEFETPGVLTDLLELITRELRSLELFFKTDDTTPASHVDLCALARACPDLLHLCLRHATLVVSEHDASLHRWPVKKIELAQCSCTLSDLVGCLRDPALRMARELVQLEVTPRKNQVFADEEVGELLTHNGEFLPLVKEKLPTSLKAAMISAATATTWSTKPIHGLDSYILSLIFVFAATPTRRSVRMG